MDKSFERAHMIGIGGAGMYPLAVLFAQSGIHLSGSDLTDSPGIRVLKERFGLKLHIGTHCAEAIPENPLPDFVVYSSAVGPENPERAFAEAHGIPALRRGEALARFMSRYRRPIAVSGSHGKTSITTLLAHVLTHLQAEPGFLVGGKVSTWSFPAALGNGDFFVTEADESDGSHTALSCELGLIPNIEDDHAWSLGGVERLYANFAQFAQQCRAICYYAECVPPGLLDFHPNACVLHVADVDAALGESLCRSLAPFQRRNAYLVLRALMQLGFTPEAILPHVGTAPMPDRRLTLHFRNESCALLEDYAHHPTELRALLEGVRERYPHWRVQAVFQPHRYQRLKRYLPEFASLLRSLDRVWVTPVFAAWVQAESVTHADLASAVGPHAEAVDAGMSWPALAARIPLYDDNAVPTLTLIIGAGDVNALIPLLLEKLR